MIQLIKTLILILIFSLSVSADSELADFFQPVSRIGASAETVRMGNFAEFSNGSHSIFSNSAALYKLYRASGTLFTTKFMDEVNYVGFSVGARTKFGIFGLGLFSAGVDDIPKSTLASAGSNPIDANASFDAILNDKEIIFVQSGIFGYRNTQLKLAYQFSRNNRLHLGVGLNIFKEHIGSISGTGMNFDAGAIYLTDRFDFSVALKNLIPNSLVKYSHGGKQQLPLESSYSVKYKAGDLTALGQIKFMTSDSKLLKGFGVEYNPNFLPYLKTSFGYKEVPIRRSIEGQFEDTAIGNFVFGFGFEVSGIQFDYAHEKSAHQLYNHKHYFSVGLKY